MLARRRGCEKKLKRRGERERGKRGWNGGGCESEIEIENENE